ncbi:MAG: PorT family protein [Sphaerochaetaceae bacterium]|nr:PorT family protein [Sphaerochaetaceae bacterium]
MRTRIILVVVLLCMATILIAQTSLNFGLKGGLNVANIAVSGDTSWDPEFLDYKSKLDFAIGSFLEIPIGPKLLLQPELLYSRKGAFHEFDSQVTVGGTQVFSGRVKEYWSLSYLQLPVLAKYKLTEKFGLFLGPSISFLLSSKSKAEFKGTYLGESYTENEEFDRKDSTESTDLSFILGGEFRMNKLLFDLRYDLGLSKVAEGDDNDFSNRTISLLIGYAF